MELKDKVFETIVRTYWMTEILAGPAQGDGQERAE